MLLFNGQKPFLLPNKYSIESYEPLDIRPEEQKQNNSFIKMAFTGKKINTPMKTIRNIHNKSMTENNISNKIYPNNTFQFGNIIKKNLFQAFNTTEISAIPNHNKQKIIVPMVEFNINQLNYPQVAKKNNRCNSSINHHHGQHIIINNTMNNNVFTTNFGQASPYNIQKKPSLTSKNIIPVYHKIVYRRKMML